MSLSLRSIERYTANQGTSIVSFFCRFRQPEKRSVALLVLPALSSAGQLQSPCFLTHRAMSVQIVATAAAQTTRPLRVMPGFASPGANTLCLFTHTYSNITLTPRSVYSCQYVRPRRGACSPWVSRRRSGVAEGKNPHPTRRNIGGVGCSLRRRLLRTERVASPAHEVVTACHLSVLCRKVVYGLAH